MLYVYSKANQMTDHNFTDDVAIVLAINKKQALKKFSAYYASVELKDIESYSLFKLFRVCVLTDY